MISTPKPTSPLLAPIHLFNRHESPSISSPFLPIMLAASSWLHSRRSRCLLLLLCSPFLLPFLCASLPLLCAVELLIRFFRRSKDADEAEDRFRRCEEGICSNGEEKEVGLLQRYLDDQLRLVGFMYDCGDDCEFDAEIEQNTPITDYRTPLSA